MITKPNAIKRLGSNIFVPQKVRRLKPNEYEVVFCSDPSLKIDDFAIALDKGGDILTFADYQKDSLGMALSGNLGSGRAVYYGDRFNVLGVGRTTLCQSNKPSHNSGRAEMIGILRRVVLSHWINHFMPNRTPTHLAVLALKETTTHKWNGTPIPLALLVRVDEGTLDRPSHIEHSPEIFFDFEKTLVEYAKLDAEFFVYRILFGAWSSGNFSLGGHMIDLETVSFTKYRGPYWTASGNHKETRFGYEAGGFVKILEQLALVKKLDKKSVKRSFYFERKKHLAKCFLMLIGVGNENIERLFIKQHSLILKLSLQFETLSKKVSHLDTNLNLHMQIDDKEDPSLLDISFLFRNLPYLYKKPNAKKLAFKMVLRKPAVNRVCAISKIYDKPFSFRDKIVIEEKDLVPFCEEVKNFISRLFKLLSIIDFEGGLGERNGWQRRVLNLNQGTPTMSELNDVLKNLVERYRLGTINPNDLDREIKKLCRVNT